MFGTSHSPMATRERLLCSVLSFPTSLRLPNLITQEETLQPLETYALFLGLIVFLSIYPWLKHVISIVLLMSLRTSGRKPFRVTTLQYASSFRNLLIDDTRTNVFPAGCPNIPFVCSILQQLHDDHRFSTDPFCALAEFKVLPHKAKKMTKRELSRQTPDCIGAKLFRTLSQIIASLTRESLEAREAEVSTLPWTQTEKDTALASCRSGQRAWGNKKPVLTLSAVTDEEGHSLETEDEIWKKTLRVVGTIFQAREEGPRHHQHEDILRYVQHAPDDISWTIDQAEFDELLALKKDLAPGPVGIPCGVYRCAGGLGSKFLFHAYKAVLEGSVIPDCFAESRTVYIPKTSDVDDLGRIIRSPDALRPLTLCKCDCKLLTSAILSRPSLVHYAMHSPSQRCIASRHMTDNIFEIGTTALAYVACAPQESGVLLTD